MQNVLIYSYFTKSKSQNLLDVSPVKPGFSVRGGTLIVIFNKAFSVSSEYYHIKY